MIRIQGKLLMNSKFLNTCIAFRVCEIIASIFVSSSRPEPGGSISQDRLIKAKIIFVGSDGSTQFSKLPNFQKILHLKFIF